MSMTTSLDRVTTDDTRGDLRVGAGSDAEMDRRPGVPMEANPPRPMGAAHWTTPDRQSDPGGILRRKGLQELTPVFGVTVAPRGISGLMRRAAYSLPDHYTSHWFMLLLADRVDALEDKALRALPYAIPAIGGAIVLTMVGRKRMRRRRSLWRTLFGT